MSRRKERHWCLNQPGAEVEGDFGNKRCSRQERSYMKNPRITISVFDHAIPIVPSSNKDKLHWPASARAPSPESKTCVFRQSLCPS